MSALFLDSLEIRNFRAFKHLVIEHLGRVNLITGKNNVGKTCLLEALRLYAAKWPEAVINESLNVRDEVSLQASTQSPLTGAAGMPGRVTESSVFNYRYLFHGRHPIQSGIEPITIGPLESSMLFKLSISGNNPRSPKSSIDPGPLAKLQPGDAAESYQFIPVNGLNEQGIARLWDTIALTDREEQVIEAMRIIWPDVQRISLIGDQVDSRHRVPVIKINEFDGPLPLKSMGEGMNRLFGLILAMTNSQNNLCLIDEIESGLHYSVLPKIWEHIFKVAHLLNVQVFATTHSWDCITAFQKAAEDAKQDEGVLIRLQTRNGKVVDTIFDEEELGIAATEQIEVR